MIDQEAFFNLIFHPFIMLWCGQWLHILKSLRELETAEKHINIKEYIRLHKYSLAFSFFAGFVAYGFLYSANQLTMAGAFTAGYMADSIISTFTDKTLKKLAGGEEERTDKTVKHRR